MHVTHAIFALVAALCAIYVPLSNTQKDSPTNRRITDMAAFDTSRTTYATAEVAGRIGKVLVSIIDAFVSWNDARITRNSLAQLTDSELDDIGLTRGDIEVVAKSR